MKIMINLTPQEIADVKDLLLDIEDLIADDVDHYGALHPLFKEWLQQEPRTSGNSVLDSDEDVEDWVTGFKVGYTLQKPYCDSNELDEMARRYYQERKF